MVRSRKGARAKAWPMIAMDTIVSDAVSSRWLLEVNGLMAAGGNAGFAVGSLIGGFFTASPALIFSLSAVLVIPPSLMGLLLVAESKPRAFGGGPKPGFLRFFSGMAQVAHDHVTLAFLGVLALVSLVWGQFYGLFPVYAEKYAGMSSSEMGVAYALEGLVLAVFSYFASRWAARYNLFTVYGIGAVLFSLASLGVAVAPSFTGILFSYSLVEAFGEMLCGPSSRSIIAELSPRDQRGRYMGLLNLFHRNIVSYAPFIGGLLMDLFAPRLLLFWVFFSSFGLLAAGLCIPLRRMASKVPKSPDTPEVARN
jgi:MFS family permease